MIARVIEVNRLRILLVAILASVIAFSAALVLSEPASAHAGTCRHSSNQHYHWWGYNTVFYKGHYNSNGKHYHRYEVHYFAYTNNYHEVKNVRKVCPG